MKPIRFNAEMVKAILDNRKMQTRRLVKINSGYFTGVIKNTLGYLASKNKTWFEFKNSEDYQPFYLTPKYQVGDILYVQETFAEVEDVNGKPFIIYNASDNGMYADENHNFKGWKPSITMPKEAARIFLKVTAVRCERLQDITYKEVEKEGVYFDQEQSSQPSDQFRKDYKRKKLAEFIKLWNSIYGNWDDNPWVWVYEFERCEKGG